MKFGIGAGIVLAILSLPVQAAVFLNEVFVNPAGSLDTTQEFIELMGPPDMKLDGYAVALVNGLLQKYYPLGSITSTPDIRPEVDEFISLDGLRLGANGILVLGGAAQSNYGTLLADSAFRCWSNLGTAQNPIFGPFNGYLDAPGKLDNDGSNSIFLLRNRPGAKSGGTPGFSGPGSPPADLRWGKDIACDTEIIQPIQTTVCVGGSSAGNPCNIDDDCFPGTCSATGDVEQFGDGSLDKGVSDSGVPASTIDMKGESTPGDTTDDLEVVDEISYEDSHGQEYDTDDRHVDNNSTSGALKPRHVHDLGDPQGFNPDCLTRVDYRTAGVGWTPVAGATGEMLNGNNWQDTATEQWIRGESGTGSGGQGIAPQLFFSNAANTDPNAVQPYMTHVPHWLNDGSGSEFNFAAASNYQIMAGRVNPLAVPFIPGDVNRDGVCDAQDIAKMAAVFGDDDHVFSNSFAESPETNSADPANQNRPWDVDLTGDNGIEASDMQWVLNFQGNTNGRVVGVRYDSTTPTPDTAQSVFLGSNAGVVCTVTASTNSLSGRPLTALKVGDLIQVSLFAQVTGGTNNAANHQNGIMQYVQDLQISGGGVLRVIDEGSQSPFISTRAIQSLLGSNLDRGISSLNGHTTSFTAGLASPVLLNRVTLQAIGFGSVNVTISAATDTKFVASTPSGLKVGHTNNNGNPVSASYPSLISMAVTSTVKPDFDFNGHVTEGPGGDLQHLIDCRTSPGIPQSIPTCLDARLDGDSDIDQSDFAIYQRCYSGPLAAPAMNCDVP